MTISVIDSRHEEMKKYVQLIAAICISDSFLSLKRELEISYRKNGSNHASRQAFQDALYAILAEEEID